MKEILQYQYKNLFLWTPFIVAFGAALYFSLGKEPCFHFPIIITALICGIFYKYKNIFVRAFALFLFGFFYAMSFTHIIDTPQIKDSFDFISVNGVVKDIDFTSDSTRVLLSINAQQIDKDLPNKYLNIRVSLKDDIPDIGDIINGDIKIFHPSPKYTTESFDFARWAYFSKISGTGFFKNYDIIKSETQNSLRSYIHDKSHSILTDSLVLGYKKVIPEQQNKIWKSVGVGHIWSISGFHMTLIGSWLFALFYLLFRSIPYITKRTPAKYPAIICAWFGLVLYLCISGISVATTRAFLMASLVFAATLLGRGVLSLRNAALAFLIIFLINPYSVMNAGFQLSFAAIFGLLWYFDNKQYIKRNFINKIYNYICLLFKSAVIATIFTLPFIIAHFGYVPVYTLIGNIVLLPIFSIIIMPLVFVGTIFAIFGNQFILNATNNAYDFTLSVANHISNLPYANLSAHNMSNIVLICIIIGFLFLVLIVKPNSKNFFIKNINYVLCILCISTGITIYAIQPKPLFYATDDHELVAFNVNDELQFNKARVAKHFFAFSSWYEFNNEKQPDKNKRYKCDRGFCVYRTTKWNLVYMQNFTAILNNIENVCADTTIDYIVTTFETKSSNCHGKILHNGLMIYSNGKVTEIISQRPWHNLHEQKTDQMQVH